jgi:hypothetical protein
MLRVLSARLRNVTELLRTRPPEDGLRSETYVGAYNNIDATIKSGSIVYQLVINILIHKDAR